MWSTVKKHFLIAAVLEKARKGVMEPKGVMSIRPRRDSSGGARRVLHWIPYGGERRRGRPATRWEDSLQAYAREYASKWEVLAQDRDIWSAWQGGFVQRAMIRQETT